MSLSQSQQRPAPVAADDGYASRQYAESLAEFGEVIQLPACGGALLARPIPDSDLLDAMGPYPLFCCRDWSRLGDDLASLAGRLVAVSMVVDPLANVDLPQLRQALPDVCYAYKEHYVVDLHQPLQQTVDAHHRRNVRKALRQVDVSLCKPGNQYFDVWCALYDNLIARHDIAGIARFSRRSFALQMETPGFTAFAAKAGGEVCGMTLWYVVGDAAYYHLAAYSDQGYALGASFALFWTALTEFARQGVRWASLGAGVGTTAALSGLTRFKQGWSTATRPAYFGGCILQPTAYRRLAGDVAAGSTFFPAYRRP